MKQPFVNYDAIVIWRKKTAYYSLVTFLTAQQGLITCILHNERLQRLKHSSYLRPFSAVHMSVVPQGDVYQLQQLDGIYVNKSMDVDLEAIGYGAFIGELIIHLFPSAQQDTTLFLKVHQFSLAIQEKKVPLASIIFGWQLLNLAGFVASESDGMDLEHFWQEIEPVYAMRADMKAALPVILCYDWEAQPRLSFSKECWTGLAEALMIYAQVSTEAPLSTLDFIRDMKLSLW